MTAAWILRIYALAVNLLLFVLMGADKHRAKKARRRVPEADLFLFALLGGSIGGLLGMLIFRHKTLHKAFVIGFPLIMLIQLAAAMWLKLFILT